MHGVSLAHQELAGCLRSWRARLTPADLQGSDLAVVVYTAPAGSADAEALAVLGAIGLQAFSD